MLVLASLWFLAAVADAQFIEVQGYTVIAPGQRKPVIADITLRTTSTTPWGTYTQVLRGKFWRSSDGKSRQDDSFGTSSLSSPKTHTWVDHELQTAMVEPAILSLFLPGTSLGKGTLLGREVKGWRKIIPYGKEDQLVTDIWTDASLGIPVQTRMMTRTTEFVQQLNNIEEREPDPELFKIPEGFSVLKCTPLDFQLQPSNRPVSCKASR